MVHYPGLRLPNFTKCWSHGDTFPGTGYRALYLIDLGCMLGVRIGVRSSGIAKHAGTFGTLSFAQGQTR